MKKRKVIMAMPVVIDIADKNINVNVFKEIFDYLAYIDNTFSTYKENSEITKINNAKINYKSYSQDMKKILQLSKKTKDETNGYFDIHNNGKLDPSGIVKGFAILKASQILKKKGYKNFYIDIAGDIEISGLNDKKEKWSVGLENPFFRTQIIKVLALTNKGIATSGNYIRGSHIWNNKERSEDLENNVMSISVIGKNVYEADRFATAAFSMGENGINFIENLSGFEAYMVLSNKNAIFTSGFENYVI